MSDQQQQPEKKKRPTTCGILFVIGIVLILVYVCGNLGLAAIADFTDRDTETPTDEKITVETKVIETPADTPILEPTEALTDTPLPEPTTWVGVIDCPACVEGENIPLTLWAEIGEMGSGSPKVNHGDICIILDKGVTEEAPGIDPGIEKYKLDCDGKIGWLRAEGVKPAEQTTEPAHVLIDPGTYVVGEDIEPGIYQGETVDRCYWERLSDFSGEGSGTITNGGGGEPGSKFYVEVMETDFGFYTSCPLVSFTPKEK